MNKFQVLQKLFVFIGFVYLTANAAFAQTTSFTYQGKLTNNGTPANGIYEMQFTLFDEPGGFEIGTPKTIPNIVVTNGIFTVVITTEDWSFDQTDRYMEIAVRLQGNVNPFTVLAPLQQITSSPKAIFANTAAFAGFSASSGNAANFSGLGIEQFVLKNVNGEIVAPRFENLSADPAPASASNTGRVYFNTTTNSLMVSNGTAWVSISKPPVQIFTGNPGTTDANCLPAMLSSPIRTVTFTKSSDASRLRITYRDTASVANSTSFGFGIYMFIDYVNQLSLSRWDVAFRHPGSTVFIDQGFTTVGYVDGIAAGTHTFTSGYQVGTPQEPSCRRTRSYLIEIEEIP